MKEIFGFLLTPDYPSLGWDADQVRLCTWGKFKDKQTGFVFMFFNLHADHVGVKSRDESVSLVLQKIKKSGGKLPVILTVILMRIKIVDVI